MKREAPVERIADTIEANLQNRNFYARHPGTGGAPEPPYAFP